MFWDRSTQEVYGHVEITDFFASQGRYRDRGTHITQFLKKVTNQTVIVVIVTAAAAVTCVVVILNRIEQRKSSTVMLLATPQTVLKMPT